MLFECKYCGKSLEIDIDENTLYLVKTNQVESKDVLRNMSDEEKCFILEDCCSECLEILNDVMIQENYE